MSGSKITTAEVVELQESNQVKLGIKCLIPDNDSATTDVLRARATERFMQDKEYMELESASERKGDIIYRRARTSAPQKSTQTYAYRPAQMMVPPPPPRSAPRTIAVTSSEKTEVMKASNAATKGQNATIRAESPDPAGPMPIRAASPKELRRVDSVQEVTKTRRSSRSRHSKHRTSIVIEAYKPEREEAEIRRLARDEVVRYRQAERMMEAHGNAYAYSQRPVVETEVAQPEPVPEPVARVPVERRIALEKDVVDRPWIKDSEPSHKLDYAKSQRSARMRTELERATGTEDVERTQKRFALLQVARELEEEQKATPRRNYASSDKTRFPGSSEPRRPKVAENPTRYDVAETEEASKAASDERFMNVERFKDAERRNAFFVKSMTRDRQAEGDSSSSSEWTDQEYWLDGQPTGAVVGLSSKTAKTRDEQPSTTSRTRRLVLQRQPIASEATPREQEVASYPRRSEGNVDRVSRHSRREYTERSTTDALPYPAEESMVSAQMPSPQPLPSKAKKSQPTDPEGEYTYVKRTVQHKRASSRLGEKPYYEVEETFGRRSKPAQAELKPQKEAQIECQRKDNNHHTSDVSSRVKFAKQVEFSPTPPGSDASSTQFRKLGRMRRDLGVTETGGDLIAEYERRGRARSRLPYEGYDYR